jgi:hypothetical protein
VTINNDKNPAILSRFIFVEDKNVFILKKLFVKSAL